MARVDRGIRLSACAFGAASAAAIASLAVACAGSDKATAVEDPNTPAKVHVETLDHEPCDEAGHRVEALDTDNDGKPDVKKVYDQSSGKEICRITDVDHDGKPDMYEYYDASGTIRRREAGYDQSGIIDAIELFQNGKLSKREFDTTGQHRVDTWDYFDANGKLARRERDSTNDGRVDQWWTFQGDKVTIAIDRTGDGTPDPADTVTMGGSDDNAKAAPAAVADAAPPPPAVYVPAGMDASALAPPPAPVATATAAPDAGAAPTSASKKKKGKQ